MSPPPLSSSPGTEEERDIEVPPLPTLDPIFLSAASSSAKPEAAAPPAPWKEKQKCKRIEKNSRQTLITRNVSISVPADPAHRGGVLLVQLVVRLSVLVVVLRLRLPAALLPHYGLFVVLPTVQAGALVDTDATHHLTVETSERTVKLICSNR